MFFNIQLKRQNKISKEVTRKSKNVVKRLQQTTWTLVEEVKGLKFTTLHSFKFKTHYKYYSNIFPHIDINISGEAE